MPRSFVCDLTDGDTVEETLMVRAKQIRTNRNGQMYLHLELDDRTGTISARHWNTTPEEARSFDVGDFLTLTGKVQSFQGQLQLIVNSFHKCDPDRVNLADFIPSSDQSIDGMLSTLRDLLGRIQDPYLKAISQAFLIDDTFLDRLCRAPAGIRHHHAYLGGLLEHIVTMLQVSDRIADLYPGLDQDLLKMGIFLHDIGKLRELSFDRGFSYSDEGQLIGHVVIGVEMLNEKLSIAGELLGEEVPAELVWRLKHLIVSHHGTYEFGSPRLPMTPEAIALHHLDNLDAKVQNYSQTIREDLNVESVWTPYDPKIGRRFYKGPIREAQELGIR